MRKYVFWLLPFLLGIVVSCESDNSEVADDEVLEDDQSFELPPTLETTACQICISINPEILPQYLCDNGDGTFTIDDTKLVRKREFDKGTNFEGLIRALESGDRFECEPGGKTK